MDARRFRQVDVFTDRPLLGNPVAVVLDASGLDTERMQSFARWTNLSETTFVLPPTVDGATYRVRIFTPASELPFAGHPTIGTAHALVEAGLAEPTADGRLVQECGAGLIDVRHVAGRLSFAAPEPVVAGPPSGSTADELAAVLGGHVVLDPHVIDVGPRWLTARLPDGVSMGDLVVDLAALAARSRAGGYTGLNLYAVDEGGTVEVRSFAPAHGVPEDPVCGSGNAAVGVHLAAFGPSDRTGGEYVARQGRFVGRDGRVQVTLPGGATDRSGRGPERRPGRVRVGGHAVTVVTGHVRI